MLRSNSLRGDKTGYIMAIWNWQTEQFISTSRAVYISTSIMRLYQQQCITKLRPVHKSYAIQHRRHTHFYSIFLKRVPFYRSLFLLKVIYKYCVNLIHQIWSYWFKFIFYDYLQTNKLSYYLRTAIQTLSITHSIHLPYLHKIT